MKKDINKQAQREHSNKEEEILGCNVTEEKYFKRYKFIGPVALLTIILYCLWWKPNSCSFE
jgi:hypothetical protein